MSIRLFLAWKYLVFLFCLSLIVQCKANFLRKEASKDSSKRIDIETLHKNGNTSFKITFNLDKKSDFTEYWLCTSDSCQQNFDTEGSVIISQSQSDFGMVKARSCWYIKNNDESDIDRIQCTPQFVEKKFPKTDSSSLFLYSNIKLHLNNETVRPGFLYYEGLKEYRDTLTSCYRKKGLDAAINAQINQLQDIIKIGPIHFLNMFQRLIVGGEDEWPRSFPGFNQQSSLGLTNAFSGPSSDKPFKVTLTNQVDRRVDSLWDPQKKEVRWDEVFARVLGREFVGHSTLLVKDTRVDADKSDSIYISWPYRDDIESDENRIVRDNLILNKTDFYVTEDQFNKLKNWYMYSPFTAYKNETLMKKIENRNTLGSDLFKIVVKYDKNILKRDLVKALKERATSEIVDDSWFSKVNDEADHRALSSKLEQYDNVVASISAILKKSTFDEKEIFRQSEILAESRFWTVTSS